MTEENFVDEKLKELVTIFETTPAKAAILTINSKRYTLIVKIANKFRNNGFTCVIDQRGVTTFDLITLKKEDNEL